MKSRYARALIDLDNILSLTDPLIRVLIGQHIGRSMLQGEVTEFDYSRIAPISADQYRDILDEFHREGVSQVEPVPGASQALNWLSRVFEVVIVTSRPIGCKRQTADWLKRNQMTYDDLVFEKQKLSLVRGSAFLVEDSGETAVQSSRYCQVYLFDYPWNRFVNNPNVRRVRGWGDVLEDIKYRLAQLALNDPVISR